MRAVYAGFWIWVCGDGALAEQEVSQVLGGAAVAEAEARGRGAELRKWLGRLTVKTVCRAEEPSAFAFLDDVAELVKNGEAGHVGADVVARYRAAGWAVQVKYEGERPAGDTHLWPLHQATSALARALDGLVTRVVDDRAWRADRFDLELAYHDRPRLTSLITIHGWWLDRDAGLLELHTHGMESFGLEDLVLREVAAVHAAAGAALLNDLAAQLATGESPAVQVRLGDPVECMPGAPAIDVEADEDEVTAWWQARPVEAPSRPGGGPALLLQADMADRVARTRPTLPRLAAWCGERAFAHGERAEVWAYVDPGDGEAWHWLELAGVGPAAWRGILIDESGERPVPIDPERIALWHLRRAGHISDG